MNISFLSDLPMGQAGAASTDEVIVSEGIRRGYDVHVVLPGMEIREADIYIVSNATLFPREVLLRLKPRVVFLHDYFPLCDFRLLYPMQPKCKGCKNQEYTLKFLQESKLVCFMSLLHFDSWCYSLPEIKELNYELIPSAFSKGQVEELKALQNSMPDKDTVLGINSLLPYKGRNLVLKYAQEHQNLRFTFVGAEGVEMLPQNCRYIGPQPWRTMLHMYATHEVVIHMPMLEPCSRVACETLLSGRKLIANRCVGVLSYFKFEIPNAAEVENLVSHSAERFWAKVQEVMG